MNGECVCSLDLNNYMYVNMTWKLYCETSNVGIAS